MIGRSTVLLDQRGKAPSPDLTSGYAPAGLAVRLHQASSPTRHLIPRHRHQQTLFSQIRERRAEFQDVGSGEMLSAQPGDLVLLPAGSAVTGQLHGRRGWRTRPLWLTGSGSGQVAERAVPVLRAEESELANQFSELFAALSSKQELTSKRR